MSSDRHVRIDKLDRMNLPFNISSIDRLGAGVSFACAIHCAIVPFAATILPLLGFGFLADRRVECTVFLTSITWLARAFAGESAFMASAAC